MHPILLRASRLGEQLIKAEPTEQRALLLEVVSRVTLAPDQIRIALHTSALRARLDSEAPTPDPAMEMPSHKLAIDLRGLPDLNAELKQLPMHPGRAPQSGLARLTSRMNRRISSAVCGRPKRGRDLLRQ